MDLRLVAIPPEVGRGRADQWINPTFFYLDF